MTPFYRLCMVDNTRNNVVNPFFNELDESKKKTFIELVNIFLKHDDGIAKQIKSWLPWLQLPPHATDEPNPSRFFHRPQTDNNISEYIEQKTNE